MTSREKKPTYCSGEPSGVEEARSTWSSRQSRVGGGGIEHLASHKRVTDFFMGSSIPVLFISILMFCSGDDLRKLTHSVTHDLGVGGPLEWWALYLCTRISRRGFLEPVPMAIKFDSPTPPYLCWSAEPFPGGYVFHGLVAKLRSLPHRWIDQQLTEWW